MLEAVTEAVYQAYVVEHNAASTKNNAAIDARKKRENALSDSGFFATQAVLAS